MPIRMIATDIDDFYIGRDAGEGFLGFAGREGGKEDLDIAQTSRVPFLDDQGGQAADAGEAIAELLAGAAFAGDVGDFKTGVGGAEAQGFSAAVAADTDDCHASSHCIRD